MSGPNRSDQENFWAQTYAQDYIRKNSSFDRALGVKGWREMLRGTEGIESILECGCNIGRNLMFLSEALPRAGKSIIEISEPAFRFVNETYPLERSFQGSILESGFEDGSFDLVFTIGVLIHLDPEQLLANMERMYRYSRRYVLMGEYFNRTPTMIEYQGERDRLFKRDFGKLFAENFKAKVIDYGFLWGYEYDAAGFDDITWWLFEKG